MKRVILIISLLIATFISQAQVSFPSIEEYKLGNGLKVYLIEYGDVPATAITLYINCGKKNEAPGQQYLSQIAASCINMGCEKYDRLTLENKLFRLGTSIGAGAGDNYTTVSTFFLNNNTEEALDIFSNALLHPTFPEKEITQLISETIDYNNASKVDIAEQANIFARFWIYGAANPLGRHFYKSQLEKITPAAIKEFYQFNYTPGNARLVLCGKMDKAKMKALIEKYFGPWTAPYGENNGASFESPVIKKKEYGFINRNNATHASLNWIKNGPEPRSKDVLPFMIANAALTDVLFVEVREKGGKTYGIGSRYSPYALSNIFSISTQVRSNEMLNTINLVDKVLNQFYANGITLIQFEKAKKQMLNNWLTIEDPRSLTAFLNPLIYPKPELRKTYISEINAITLADINKIIKRYFTTNAYKLVIAGDQNQLNEQLKQLPGLKIFSAKDIEVDQ